MQTPITGTYYYGGPGINSLQLAAYVVVSQVGSNDTHPSTDHWQQMYGYSGTSTDAFLAVNGAPSEGVFFKQDVVLVGGQTYKLSGWGANAVTEPDGNPEIGLRLRNSSGTIVSTATTGIMPVRAGATGAPTDTKWVEATINYTAASTGKYTIEYYNVSVASAGNDFGIDNLSVRPLTEAGCPKDYGDAPDTAGTGPGQDDYQTLAASGGPSHNLVSGLFLGSSATAEANGLPNSTATGDWDDALSSISPVTSVPSATVTFTIPVTNQSGQTATLRGFIDFNRDGDFLDFGETAVTTVPHLGTSGTLTFTVPVGVRPGLAFMRLRLALVASEISTATGNATSGEVEDYGFSIRPSFRLLKNWANANIGDAVTISGSGLTTLNATAGSANETHIGTRDLIAGGTSVTFTEAYTTGSSASYYTTFSCTRDYDSVALTITGTGLSRTVTMPGDSSVSCTTTNTRIVPLSLTKTSTTYSDGINVAARAKRIPGGVVTYTITVSNPGALPITTDTIYVTDPLPTQIAMIVGDYGVAGSGPVSFSAGTSGLTYTYTSLGSTTDGIEFSSNGGSTWTKVPTPGASNADTTVTNIRIHPKGTMAAGSSFSFSFRALIK